MTKLTYYIGLIGLLLILSGCASKHTVELTPLSEATPPEQLIKYFITGSDSVSCSAMALLDSYPVDSLIDWISNFNDYPKPEKLGEPIEYYHQISDSLNAPYYVLIPQAYNPSKPTPMMIWLHGGVSRPVFSETDPVELMEHPIFQQCKEQGWIVVFPLAKNGCLWWDEVGMDHVDWIVREMKTKYNIDDNKVNLGGFSDGGSGSFHIAMLTPTDFGQFFPWSGNIAVGSLVGKMPVYVPNMRARKVYASNGGADPLYPVSKMKPMMQMVVNAGVDLKFTAYDTAGHNYGYLVDEWPQFVKRVAKNERNPSQPNLYWEASDMRYNRVDWLEITGLDTAQKRESWHLDYNYLLTDDRITIGFNIDQGWKLLDKGKGIRVGSVLEDDSYPAAQMGLQKGDIIIAMDNISVKGVEDLAKLKAKKRRGDKISLMVMRDEIEVLLDALIPSEIIYDAFVRDTPSGAVEATRYLSNEYKVLASRVSDFSIYVDPRLIRMDEAVKVTVNGIPRYHDIVPTDARFLLENFRKDRDRTRLYAGRIDVEL